MLLLWLTKNILPQWTREPDKFVELEIKSSPLPKFLAEISHIYKDCDHCGDFRLCQHGPRHSLGIPGLDFTCQLSQPPG